ncbi:MAG: CZB domain-containing protein [Deltaproteobacteria bacterium]|nr:CZB domain-containing protein [Deltaproteobacteria bacterium]MDH4122056.1 CZB domain-containing protein [Deltaproteobacteria bacterium]
MSATLDFMLAITRHLSWKTRLRGFLDGRETLTEAQATSHTECDLGKWIYAHGLERYGNLPDMVALEKIHQTLHATVKSIYQLKTQGNLAEAEKDFLTIEPISQQIVTLLKKLETQTAA